MKVYNIGTAEQEIIIEALDYLGGTYKQLIENEEDALAKEEAIYREAHIRTILTLLKDQRLQELCERCLSYFADRLFDGGSDEWPEIEGLSDDMELNDEELKELFREVGYEED